MADPPNNNGRDDPFDWNVDRVVKELCTLNRTWVPTPRMQFPDPLDLEAKLRENEYDGELLLTAKENDLWNDFGISKTKLKHPIRSAIRQFQKRSPALRKYNNFHRDSSDDEKDIKERSDFLTPSLTDAPTPNTAFHDGPVFKEAPEQEPVQNPTDGLVEPNSTAIGESIDMLKRARRAFSEISEKSEDGHKNKKRRLAMTALVPIESAPVDNMQAKFGNLTEADMFQDRLPELPTDLLDRLQSGPTAYWGNGSIPVDYLVGLDSTEDSDVEFTLVRSKRIGPGKIQRANGAFKRYLLQPTSARQTEEELPVFGESDDDDGDNSEWETIRREFEEEQEEVRRERLHEAKSTMQPDAVNACIESIINSLVARWQEKKLPSQQRKAYGLWTKAASARMRLRQTVQLQQRLRDQTARLEAQTRNLRDNSYKRQKELEDLGVILEPTVFEMESLKWTIGILTSPYAPDRVSTAEAPRRGIRNTVAPDGGIDIWSESEDDSLDDFIVDDDYGPLNHTVDRALPAISNTAVDHMMLDVSSTLPPSEIPPGQSFGASSDVSVQVYDLTNIEDSGNEGDLLSRPEPKVKSKLRPESESKPKHGDSQDDSQDGENKDFKSVISKGPEYWLKQEEYANVVMCLISGQAQTRQEKILEAASYSDSAQDFWADEIIMAIEHHHNVAQGIAESSSDKIRHAVAMTIAQLFGAYTGEITDSDSLPEILHHISPDGNNPIPPPLKNTFGRFWRLLQSFAPLLGSVNAQNAPLRNDHDQDLDIEVGPGTQQSTKAVLAKAARLREDEKYSSQVNELRRLEFRKAVQVPEGALVINEAKKADQGLVYFHHHIAAKIRPHQIEGVRFMWDEITKDTHRGCLLSHTMGLGKTMQVIALLIALIDAAFSDDETIRSQVPEHLRDGKVTVLCPAGLINNWLDELAYWAPERHLGEITAIVAAIPASKRPEMIEKWAFSPGPSILLCGYELFAGLDQETISIVLDKSSLVIGDEAHRFKNQDGVLQKTVAEFKSTSRIALTGSPLSNNIEEYYAMLNWVSPGYLGDMVAFRAKWGRPIEYGLQANSSRAAKKKSQIVLAGLQKLVKTKVHRRSALALKDALPPKQEFIIYLRLTDFQLKVYDSYLQKEQEGQNSTQKLSNGNVWALQSHVGLLLAHPSIYYNNLVEAASGKTSGKKAKKAKKRQATGDDPDAVTPDLDPEVWSESLKLFHELGDKDRFGLSHKVTVLNKILEDSIKMEEKVLIFSHRLAVLDFIEERLLIPENRRFIRIDGGSGTADRQSIAKRFNSGTAQVCLISTTAGGVGLNLQSASRVVMMDFKYNPQHENQAIGRAFRIGQTKPVKVYWLIVSGTMEMEMQNTQIFKMQMTSRVVDSKAPIAKSSKDLKKWFAKPEQVEPADFSAFKGQDSILDGIMEIEGAVANVVAAESFEEEDLEAELQPDEIKQAMDMAEGRIDDVPMPAASPLQLPGFQMQQPQTQVGEFSLPPSSVAPSQQPSQPTMPPSYPSQYQSQAGHLFFQSIQSLCASIQLPQPYTSFQPLYASSSQLPARMPTAQTSEHQSEVEQPASSSASGALMQEPAVPSQDMSQQLTQVGEPCPTSPTGTMMQALSEVSLLESQVAEPSLPSPGTVPQQTLAPSEEISQHGSQVGETCPPSVPRALIQAFPELSMHETQAEEPSSPSSGALSQEPVAPSEDLAQHQNQVVEPSSPASSGPLSQQPVQSSATLALVTEPTAAQSQDQLPLESPHAGSEQLYQPDIPLGSVNLPRQASTNLASTRLTLPGELSELFNIRPTVTQPTPSQSPNLLPPAQQLTRPALPVPWSWGGDEGTELVPLTFSVEDSKQLFAKNVDAMQGPHKPLLVLPFGTAWKAFLWCTKPALDGLRFSWSETWLGLLVHDESGKATLMIFDKPCGSSSAANEQSLQSAARPFAHRGLTIRHLHDFGGDETPAAAAEAGVPQPAAMRPMAPPLEVAEPGVPPPPMSASVPSPSAPLGNSLPPDNGFATAKKDFMESFRSKLKPSNKTLCDDFVQEMEQAMNALNSHGLQRRQAWRKLNKIVRSMPEAAETMMQLAEPKFVKMLVTADKAEVVIALEQGLPAQDPVHARRSLSRSDKHESGTTATSRMVAAMEEALRKKDGPEKVKEERRKSKKPRVSERPSPGSKDDPWVID